MELVGRTGGGPVAFAILSAQVSDAGAPLFSPAGEVGAACAGGGPGLLADDPRGAAVEVTSGPVALSLLCSAALGGFEGGGALCIAAVGASAAMDGADVGGAVDGVAPDADSLEMD